MNLSLNGIIIGFYASFSLFSAVFLFLNEKHYEKYKKDMNGKGLRIYYWEKYLSASLLVYSLSVLFLQLEFSIINSIVEFAIVEYMVIIMTIVTSLVPIYLKFGKEAIFQRW